VTRLLGGRYRIVEPLGGGGTSLVFRAQPLDGGPEVAVKELRPQFAADPSLRRRFLREAELGRALNHPGIVRTLDAGEERGLPYLVLELVRAATLRARLDRDGRLSPESAWSIFVALAQALDHAHGHGVIHRDIKPQNIFVDGPLVKLGDFGNARVVSLASVTGASLSWGTPEYVAPETFGRGRADPRSDLYSLGVVLYEMLAGKLPWTRAETLARLAGGGAKKPGPPPSGAGEGFDFLLGELLAFSPADRPASGEEIRTRYAEGALAAPTRTTCSACGAPLPEDIPRCLSCGHEALRVGHDPEGRWRLILSKLADDAAQTEKLLRLLDALARPTDRPLVFLTGDPELYSREERLSGISLPAVLFSHLDEPTARGLESLFRQQGLDVRAIQGDLTAKASLGKAISLPRIWIFGVVWGAILGAIANHVPWGFAGGATFGGALVGAALFDRRRRTRSAAGIVCLRQQIAAVPVADRLLADAAGAAARVRAPEVRALLGDVATEVYRLTRRAAQLGGEATAPSSEAALLGRMAAAAPALVDRLAGVAARLDALDDALAGPSEGELMQTLARLERAARAPGADRDALAAARRDADAALDRRHAAEGERARLSAALCQTLGRLRAVCRQALALETLDEREARAVEASSAELEAFLGDRSV
jgi:serine/threonine protein kinase